MKSALALDNAAHARDVARLGSYARQALELAAHHAHRLHAQEIAPEHLLSSLFLDESAAATRLVLFAFADPETLALELLALSPGIMVVGSERSLPFSVRGVRVLEAARQRAIDADAQAVLPEDLLVCALGELDAETQALLATVGLERDKFEHALEAQPARADRDPDSTPIPTDGSLFVRFDQCARRALGLAARSARQWQRDSISPAHLLLGSLESDDALTQAVGARPSRLRMALGGRDHDTTPLEERALPLDGDLVKILASLPDGAGTVSILGQILSHGSEEARLLLQRQRVTWELFERAQASFQDPEAEICGSRQDRES